MDDFLTTLAMQSIAAGPAAMPSFGVQAHLASRFEPVRPQDHPAADLSASMGVEEVLVEHEAPAFPYPDLPMPEPPVPRPTPAAAARAVASQPAIRREERPRYAAQSVDGGLLLRPSAVMTGPGEMDYHAYTQTHHHPAQRHDEVEEEALHDTTMGRIEQFVSTSLPHAPGPERETTVEPAPHRPPRLAVTNVPDTPEPSGGTPPRTAGEAAQIEMVQSVVRALEPVTAITPRLEPAAALKPKGLASHVEPPPTIHVTIGRIEVRAALPAAPQARKTGRAPVLTLDEYLRQRNGGGR